MTCGDELATILAAVQWWHVLLVFPASVIWTLTSRAINDLAGVIAGRLKGSGGGGR